MRTLVVYGTKRAGTFGIAEMIGDALTAAGIETDVRPAERRTARRRPRRRQGWSSPAGVSSNTGWRSASAVKSATGESLLARK